MTRQPAHIIDAEDSAGNPLLINEAFPYRQVFFPLGFAVEVETNSPAILLAAAESWKSYPRVEATPMLTIALAVRQTTATACPPTPVLRAQGHLLTIVADAENFAACDLRQGYGFGWVNEPAINNRSYVRYHFLEAMALILICSIHAVAIHGACVSRNGRGLLLCANSGMGKSSLAFACAKAGWTYTSDDASYLLFDDWNPVAGGWVPVRGNSHQIRFRPTAAAIFPEIGGRELTPRAEGKPSIEIPMSEFPEITTAEEASIRGIILLNRRPGIAAQLCPASMPAVRACLEAGLALPREVRERQRLALRRLLALPAYELHYSDLPGALRLLGQMADQAANDG
jgi:hypothetical protein